MKTKFCVKVPKTRKVTIHGCVHVMDNGRKFNSTGGDIMEALEIALDENGNKIVVMLDIIFAGKQNIDWNEVEKYLEHFVGKLVGTASDGRFRENRKEEHFGDASNGWYCYTMRFAISVYNNDNCDGFADSICSDRARVNFIVYERDGKYGLLDDKGEN